MNTKELPAPTSPEYPPIEKWQKYKHGIEQACRAQAEKVDPSKLGAEKELAAISAVYATTPATVPPRLPLSGLFCACVKLFYFFRSNQLTHQSKAGLLPSKLQSQSSLPNKPATSYKEKDEPNRIFRGGIRTKQHII